MEFRESAWLLSRRRPCALLWRRAALWGMLACLFLLSPSSVSQGVRIAGVRRPPPRPLLTLVLTVSATPSSVSFALVSGGVAAGSSSVAITTSCVLGLGVPVQFSLYGYFASATGALSGGTPTMYIPSSSVLGKVPTGSPTSFTAFSQTGGFGPAGGSLLLWTTTSDLCLLSSRTDNLFLEINLAAVPQLPAATYTGTLYLQAQAL